MPRTSTSPRRGAQLDPCERMPVGGDLRARLGHPVGGRHRDTGHAGSLEQRRRDRPSAEQRPAQRRRLAQPRVEQPREHRRHERDQRDPLAGVHQRGAHRLGLEPLVQHRRRAVDRAAHGDRQPPDVHHRHRAQPALALVEPERDRRPERAPEEVPVRQLDRPWRCGRPRGVYHRRDRIRIEADRRRAPRPREQRPVDDEGRRPPLASRAPRREAAGRSAPQRHPRTSSRAPRRRSQRRPAAPARPDPQPSLPARPARPTPRTRALAASSS